VTLQADLIALNDEIAAKRAKGGELLKDIDTLDGTKAAERAAELRALDAELNDLGAKRDAKQADVDAIERAKASIKTAQRANGPRLVESPKPESDEDAGEDVFAETGAKSVRDLLRNAMNARGIKSFAGYRGDLGELATKTLIQSSALAPQAERQDRIVPFATEERTTVGDLLLQGTTTAQAIEYFEETTFTNAAAPVTEGNAKPEAALAFTLRTDTVRKIAVWVPVTDEMMADVPTFESYIRARLAFMVKQEEEDQLLNGSGTAPAIQGILNRTGVQTVTGYGLSTLDSIYRGMTEIRVDAFAEPDAIVLHPRDWEDVRLSKDDNGNYLLGPANDEGPARVWGLRVVVTTNIAENTGLVGAFRPHAQVFRRSGIDVAISTENEDYFLKNKVAVRAEERLALAVYRPAAFCKVEALVQGS
jgi:HK97 family phage major capsid protein